MPMRLEHLVGVFPVTFLQVLQRHLSFPFRQFRSRRDLESEISALRAEFSARPVIAAQTPRVGRLVGAGTEPEDEDEEKAQRGSSS